MDFKKTIDNICNIKILNYKAINNKSPLEIDLENNFITLVGENGSGKTTILEAIQIALHKVKDNWYEQYSQEFPNQRPSNLDFEIDYFFNDLPQQMDEDDKLKQFLSSFKLRYYQNHDRKNFELHHKDFYNDYIETKVEPFYDDFIKIISEIFQKLQSLENQVRNDMDELKKTIPLDFTIWERNISDIKTKLHNAKDQVGNLLYEDFYKKPPFLDFYKYDVDVIELPQDLHNFNPYVDFPTLYYEMDSEYKNLFQSSYNYKLFQHRYFTFNSEQYEKDKQFLKDFYNEKKYEYVENINYLLQNDSIQKVINSINFLRKWNVNHFNNQIENLCNHTSNIYVLAKDNETQNSYINSETSFSSLLGKLDDDNVLQINKFFDEHLPSFEKKDGVTYFIDKKDKGIKVKEKTGNIVSVSMTSKGRQWYIKYLLLKRSLKAKDIFILDEPANHLHPKAQVELLQDLKKLSREKDVKIILSTHSPYLINDEDLIYQVNMTNEGITATRTDFTSISKMIEGNYHQLAVHKILNSNGNFFDELFNFIYMKYKPKYKITQEKLSKYLNRSKDGVKYLLGVKNKGTFTFEDASNLVNHLKQMDDKISFEEELKEFLLN